MSVHTSVIVRAGRLGESRPAEFGRGSRLVQREKVLPEGVPSRGMAKLELDLPDRISSEIERLVRQEEFLNEEQATEELLTMGLSVYDIEDDEPTTTTDDDLFTQAVSDQQDPAARDSPGEDEYGF